MKKPITYAVNVVVAGLFATVSLPAPAFDTSQPTFSWPTGSWPTLGVHVPVSALPGAPDLPGFTDPHGRIPSLPFHHLSAPVLPQVGPRTDFATQPDGQLAPASVNHFMNIYGPSEMKQIYKWPNPRLQTLAPGGINQGFLDSSPRPFPKISPPRFGAHQMGPAMPTDTPSLIMHFDPLDAGAAPAALRATQKSETPTPVDGRKLAEEREERFERAMHRSTTPSGR
jgi:hypothetical protein